MAARILYTIYRLLDLYQWLIVIECLLSWLRMLSPVIDDAYVALGKITEPFVGLFRRFIPPIGGIDFSPLVALLVLQIIERIL